MAWIRNKHGGWFEVDDEEAAKYMNNKIREGAKKESKEKKEDKTHIKDASKELHEAYSKNAPLSLIKKIYAKAYAKKDRDNAHKELDAAYKKGDKTKIKSLYSKIRKADAKYRKLSKEISGKLK